MTNARRLIFYRTIAIDDNARSGSGLRPARLLQAFRMLGYEVDVVAGPAAERKLAIAEVKRKVESGTAYDFLYAEPPTAPILVNESHHLPTHPLLDYELLRFSRSHDIPVLLFYCDVQWRLPDYPRRIGWIKYAYVLPFFYLDLAVYRRVVDVLLVPDRGMLPQIPGWPASKPVAVSIPGYDPAEQPAPRLPKPEGAPLRLFYVGGIEHPVYDLSPLLEGVAWSRGHGLDVELTICTREPEWLRRPREYDRHMGPHVRVVHNRTRQELLDLYATHDIAVMPYGTVNSDWAMPIKFPEAIGLEVPVLAGGGTAVARMVAEQGIGWEVGPRVEDLHRVLSTIDGAELERVRAAVIQARPAYSWTGRAAEIASIADQVKRRPAESVARPA